MGRSDPVDHPQNKTVHLNLFLPKPSLPNPLHLTPTNPLPPPHRSLHLITPTATSPIPFFSPLPYTPAPPPASGPTLQPSLPLSAAPHPHTAPPTPSLSP